MEFNLILPSDYHPDFVPHGALKLPKAEHVSDFVLFLLPEGFESKGWGPASTRGCLSRGEGRNFATEKFRALTLIPPGAQNERGWSRCLSLARAELASLFMVRTMELC